MIFAWWMATLCDGYSSAYYRRKPLLCAPTACFALLLRGTLS